MWTNYAEPATRAFPPPCARTVLLTAGRRTPPALGTTFIDPATTMLLRDLRCAIRALRKTSGVFLIGILTLALGVTTVMFGILDAVIHPYVRMRSRIGCSR